MTIEPQRAFLKDRHLTTPALLAGYRIGDYPAAGLRSFPWQATGTQGLVLNAYDLLANRRTRAAAIEIERSGGDIHDDVAFDGPIILDSGAFNFLQHEILAITPLEVLARGLACKADALVVLDHPFSPSTTSEEVQTRLNRTRDNTRAMFEALANWEGRSVEGFTLVPVLHGHDRETLERSLAHVRGVFGPSPAVVGIGSLAPLAKNGHTRKAVDVILTVRGMLPDAHIHVFSMGSPLLMLFAFYCGADTVDSQTWMMTAAFKQVQLPGYHQTRLSAREAGRNPTRYEGIRQNFAQHLLKLTHEEGFAVRNWDTNECWRIANESEAVVYLTYLEDEAGVNHIHRRACHNLYSANFETNSLRMRAQEGTAEAFIASRMLGTAYRRRFDDAVAHKHAMASGG